MSRGTQRDDAYVDAVDPYEDEHEYYERMFSPLRSDRAARRKRKPQPRHVPKVSEDEAIAGLADIVGLEGGFQTTYRPGRHEEEWLLSSLRSFYDEALITDVLASIKGGKEASVYRCQAHPSTGVPFLAAKVYRPRMFRTLRNDARYRRGRSILTAEGRAVKKSDHRVMRAIGKKTAFGVQVMHTSWLMHEFATLQTLYAAGGAVPQPIASTENAILMAYVGDAILAAPTLNEVRLEPDEAERLFREVLRNIDLMLEQEMIHGDLSAYNILYWRGEIVLIDFPQVTSSYGNRDAYAILRRDIERVCQYFRRQGVPCDPAALVDRFWSRCADAEAARRAAEMYALEMASQDG